MRALAPAREDRFQSAEEMRQALADVMAEIAPRADTERVAGFVRGLYEAATKEERAEREKLLAEAKLLPPAPAAPSPAATPLPAVTPPPESAARHPPALAPAISLEALVAPRCRSRRARSRRRCPASPSRARRKRWASTSSAA